MSENGGGSAPAPAPTPASSQAQPSISTVAPAPTAETPAAASISAQNAPTQAAQLAQPQPATVPATTSSGSSSNSEPRPSLPPRSSGGPSIGSTTATTDKASPSPSLFPTATSNSSQQQQTARTPLPSITSFNSSLQPSAAPQSSTQAQSSSSASSGTTSSSYSRTDAPKPAPRLGFQGGVNFPSISSLAERAREAVSQGTNSAGLNSSRPHLPGIKSLHSPSATSSSLPYRSNPMSVSSMLSGPPRDHSLNAYAAASSSTGGVTATGGSPAVSAAVAAAAAAGTPPQPPTLPPLESTGATHPARRDDGPLKLSSQPLPSASSASPSPGPAGSPTLQSARKPTDTVGQSSGAANSGGSPRIGGSIGSVGASASDSSKESSSSTHKHLERSSYPPLPSAYARESPYSPWPVSSSNSASPVPLAGQGSSSANKDDGPSSSTSTPSYGSRLNSHGQDTKPSTTTSTAGTTTSTSQSAQPPAPKSSFFPSLNTYRPSQPTHRAGAFPWSALPGNQHRTEYPDYYSQAQQQRAAAAAAADSHKPASNAGQAGSSSTSSGGHLGGSASNGHSSHSAKPAPSTTGTSSVLDSDPYKSKPFGMFRSRYASTSHEAPSSTSGNASKSILNPSSSSASSTAPHHSSSTLGSGSLHSQQQSKSIHQHQPMGLSGSGMGGGLGVTGRRENESVSSLASGHHHHHSSATSSLQPSVSSLTGSGGIPSSSGSSLGANSSLKRRRSNDGLGQAGAGLDGAVRPAKVVKAPPPFTAQQARKAEIRSPLMEVDSSSVWEAIKITKKSDSADVAGEKKGDAKETLEKGKQKDESSAAAKDDGKSSVGEDGATIKKVSKEKETENRPHLGRVVYDPFVNPASLLDGTILRRGVGGVVEVAIPTSILGKCRYEVGPPQEYEGDAIGLSPSDSMSTDVDPQERDRQQLAIPGHVFDFESLRRRKVWGTDVYTDDSDVLAICIHSGWLRLASRPPTSKPVSASKSANEALIVKLVVAPALIRYHGSSRQGLRSRSWGNGHDGVSLIVQAITPVATRPQPHGRRWLKVRAGQVAKQLAQQPNYSGSRASSSVSSSTDGGQKVSIDARPFVLSYGAPTSSSGDEMSV
ncbi:hypothetical protein T439DRAFT_376477 [Meredithblackwellia eburnea MCA 4105]